MIRILLIIIVLGAPCLSRAETIHSVYLDGIAPITVDGDLSDWKFIPGDPVPITHLF
jgi:hypothetical protein